MRMLLPLATLTLGACAADLADDPISGKADDGDGSDESEIVGLELARCFVTAGTDDFFDPDSVRCAFVPDAFGQAGVVNLRVEYPCGIDSDGFFAGDLAEGEEVVVSRLTVADNTCDGQKAAYPVDLELRFGGTRLAPRFDLVWRATLDGPDDATADNPRHAVISAAPISIEVENQLVDAPFARLGLSEIEIALGELVAIERNTSDAEELGSLTTAPEVEIFRSSEAPEVRAIEVWAPLGHQTLAGTVDFGDAPSAITLPAATEWILGDTGLEQRPTEVP
jgi:hypothetical protein